VLDEAAIAAKLADTAAVSALLSTIFTDDESADWPEDRHTPPSAFVPTASETTPNSTESTVAGLDAPHSKLLRQLAEQPSWSRSDFDQLASQFGLLPDAAMERLNDVALDTADDFILDGDEQLTVNPHTLQEMLV
jgi:hypothetical protein